MPLLVVLLVPILAWSQNTQALYKDCTEYTTIAKKSFQELQTGFGDSGYGLALRGEAKFQNRQYAAALDLYSRAAKRLPELRGVHAALSTVYVAMGDRETAGAESKAEGTPDCAMERLPCDFAAGRYADVLSAAESRTGPEQLYWRARAARELANQSCNRLAALPDSVESHKRNAEELETRLRYRDAAAEWRAALNLSSGNLSVAAALGRALFLSQDYKAVVPELEELLKLQPNSANASFFVGDALFESEEVDEAVPYLETALQKNPQLLPAQVTLGLCYVKLGQPAKAIPHLKAGLSLDQGGAIYYQLSRAYQATGQSQLAREMMARYEERRQETTSPAQ